MKYEDCLLNQLGSVAVKTLDNSSYVYCVNAHYYTKNNFLCSINILSHSNKLFERLNLKKSATIFYQYQKLFEPECD